MDRISNGKLISDCLIELVEIKLKSVYRKYIGTDNVTVICNLIFQMTFPKRNHNPTEPLILKTKKTTLQTNHYNYNKVFR